MSVIDEWLPPAYTHVTVLGYRDHLDRIGQVSDNFGRMENTCGPPVRNTTAFYQHERLWDCRKERERLEAENERLEKEIDNLKQENRRMSEYDCPMTGCGRRVNDPDCEECGEEYLRRARSYIDELERRGLLGDFLQEQQEQIARHMR